MFYAQTKGDDAAVVYVIAIDNGKAVVLAEDGTLQAVALADLTVTDVSKATPYAHWPTVVQPPEE